MLNRMKLKLSIFKSMLYTIIQFLINSPTGILLLSCTLYLFLEYNDQRVFGPSELALWLSGQNDEVIGSIIGTIVTVLGFIIAYSSGMTAWKKQQYYIMKQDLYKDIDKFSSKFLSLITSCKIFINSTLKLKEDIDAGRNIEKSKFMLTYMVDQFRQWSENQCTLASMEEEYCDILIRNAPVIISINKVSKRLDIAEAAISKVVENSYISIPPGISPITDENYIDAFKYYSSKVDVDSCKKLVNEITINHSIISYNLSAAKGDLSYPIITPNLSFILGGVRLLKQIKNKK
ncbi:TPA: hypothetical protein ACRNSX_004716 [Pseudomonas aeruginosa]|nr:hypothetical protein [Pseudomonas aeruginosa]